MYYECDVFYLSELRKFLKNEYCDNMALIECMTDEDEELRRRYEEYNEVIIGRIQEIKEQINNILKGKRVYLILDKQCQTQDPL